MFQDAYNAVTLAEKWEWLKHANIETFMFGTEPEIAEISSKMKYDGHSGASFGTTMRTMELIAKKGWEVFINGIQGPAT